MVASSSASNGGGGSTTGNSSGIVTSASSSQNHSHTLHHRSHHDHHQLQNISISDQQSTKGHNEDKLHVQQQTKGLKRRNESEVTAATAAPVVLGSNSAVNISHERDQEMTSGGGGGEVNVIVNSSQLSSYGGLAINKCNGTSAMYLNTKHSHEDNNGRGGNNNNDDDSTCDGEEYDYSSILARILNEKKLALSQSPEVVQFLQNPSNDNPSKGEEQDRILMD